MVVHTAKSMRTPVLPRGAHTIHGLQGDIPASANTTTLAAAAVAAPSQHFTGLQSMPGTRNGPIGVGQAAGPSLPAEHRPTLHQHSLSPSAPHIYHPPTHGIPTAGVYPTWDVHPSEAGQNSPHKSHSPGTLPNGTSAAQATSMGNVAQRHGGSEVMADAPGEPSVRAPPSEQPQVWRPVEPREPDGAQPSHGPSRRDPSATYGHAGNRITEKNSSKFKGVTKHRRSGRYVQQSCCPVAFMYACLLREDPDAWLPRSSNLERAHF